MLYKLKAFFLKILGDIKVFRYPFFIIYDPTTYFVKGTQTREAINRLKPGDIILRKYVAYLDGFLIPGKYSHTGVYVGNNTVIHAVAEGVVKIDIIDFLRCDGFCILRPRAYQARAIMRVTSWLGRDYDFEFKHGNMKFYCHELGMYAYKELSIEPVPVSFMGKTIRWMKPRYLADSFLNSPDFKKIYEY